MGGDGGRTYSFTEVFAIKFVLADVIIIAALVLAPPIYAVLITALFVLTTIVLWFLMREDRAPESDDLERRIDPVTKLQDRYAAGDLSEEEFERRLEKLIDSNERAEAAGVETRELEFERSR